jgi:uncharacterized membrane-anchored protein
MKQSSAGDLTFWIVKTLPTTVDETGGDALQMILNLAIW